MSRPATAGPDALKVLALSFGAAVVIATGALLVLRSVRSRPAEPVAAAAPEPVPAPAAAREPVPPAPPPASDRMMVVGGAPDPEPAPQAAGPAVPAAAENTAAPAKKTWVKHISGSLPPVDVRSR